MDTRTKIIGFEAAVALAQTKTLRWVSGYFDPLLVEHVRRVREFIAVDQTLIVVVTNPEHPLLAQRARAELVAALAGVDYVVMKESPGASDEPEDERIRSGFIHHVMGRHPA